MPAARAASAREAPSRTSAKASSRRAARASRHRPAPRRRPPASSSRRVIATVIAPPPIGYTADQRPRAARGATHPTVRSRGRWCYDAGKKVRGKKRHILVDTLGLLLSAAIQPADVQDRDGAIPLLRAAR